MKSEPVAKKDNQRPRKRLTVHWDDLQSATDDGIISSRQAEDLWTRLSARQASRPGFDLASVAWYSGAVVVMIAMGWFLTEVWDLFSGGGILVTALAYAGLFLFLGNMLWKKEDLRVPGGLLVTLAVSMTPLVVYAAQRMLGMWTSHDIPFAQEVTLRLMMEGGTVVAGLLALRFFRFPFLTAPLSLAVWLTGMDAISLVAGHNLGWDEWRSVTLAFGLAMVAGSYLVDLRSSRDFAFWGYLVGTTAFWWSLTLLLFDGGSDAGKFVYFVICAGLMVASVVLDRKVLVVYGAAGAIFYLGYLAFSVFAGSALFPFVLSLMGLAVIYAGVKYHRNRDAVSRLVLSLLPAGMRDWMPRDDR